MWIRHNKIMINLDKCYKIRMNKEGLSGNPCIEFIHGFGQYLPISTEIEYPDTATAERWFDEIQKAMKADVTIFDMR